MMCATHMKCFCENAVESQSGVMLLRKWLRKANDWQDLAATLRLFHACDKEWLADYECASIKKEKEPV